MKPDSRLVPEWVSGKGTDADVVISTRTRLARNLAAYPFPWRASEEVLNVVARKVRAACAELTTHIPGLKACAVEKLTLVQKSFLVDAHLASAEQVSPGVGKLLVLEPSGVFSIMVNEEDHIRLQVIRSGLRLRETWEMADWADDILSSRLDFAFSPQFGYLTAHVSNTGTGLRISALMHLAGLAKTGGLSRHLHAATGLAVAVRGVFGEASRPAGDMYQVSNEITLGIPETEIVERVRSVTEYLLCRERDARNRLLESNRSRVLREAEAALKCLSSAMSLGSGEALELISRLRLACSLGLMPNCPLALTNELLLAVQTVAGDDAVAKIERARIMRERVKYGTSQM
ncbi:MAG: hypothetical protein QHI38_10210 [Armatimonadota bacterium]|nr:hypothetical protein [Armatimonadota bacterium]